MSNSEQLAEFIRTRRKLAGLTQAGLVRELARFGIHYVPTTVSMWESKGNAPVGDPDFATALAMSLNVTPLELYEAAGILLENTDVEIAKLTTILENATPSELDRIEEFAKFIIGSRKSRKE